MARVIESPGVEIKELDLSLNASLPVGTKVLVNGFASQGPTNELLYISNTTEMNNIFFGGVGPTNAAERYFYHSCNEVLNSPATLLVTRLPYGSGAGTGYSGEYSALAYPAVGYAPSATDVSVPNTLLATVTVTGTSNITGTLPSLITLSSFNMTVSTLTVTSNTNGVLGDDNGKLIGNYNINTGSWNISSILGNYTTGVTISASYDYTKYVNIQTDFSTSTSISMGQPYVVPLTEAQYEQIKTGQIDWLETQTAVPSTFADIGNAAMVLVNDAKTSINEKHEGYYVVIADNAVANDNVTNGYNSVTAVKTLDTSSTLRDMPDVLGFALTGTVDGATDNISEKVETAFNFDFSNPYYDDTLVMYIFKLRTSDTANDPTKLFYIPVEKYAGSLEINDKRTNGTTSQLETFYLANRVNESSAYIKLYVNRNISEKATVQEVSNNSRVLNPIGSYTPCKAIDDSAKYIGNVSTKLDRSLALAENVLDLDVDIVLDAGLSTVFAYTQRPIVDADEGGITFDEALNVSEYMDETVSNGLCNSTSGNTSPFAQLHKTIFDKFNNFCQNTRKDCIHISDPIRGIFVQGSDTKVMSLKSKNFSQHIYTPMRNVYSGYNSNYSCTYANWIRKYDDASGKFVWLPFSGWEAAIMARMDSNLYPWYAPFGLNNGIIRNITDIAARPNQKQNDMLYRIGVNPVVFFNGDGFVVWGQKTLQAKPSAFDRLNVRRLFLVLERATMKVMRYFVGEPNTVFTRTRVNNVLKPVFDLAKNNEGVYDYKIICDENNNTPDVIDNNEMHVSIYLKPVRTAEFIIVTFVATRTDQNFAELTV